MSRSAGTPEVPRVVRCIEPRTLGMLMAFVGMLFVSTDSLITRAADVDGWTVTFWYGTFTAPAMLVVMRLQGRGATAVF